MMSILHELTDANIWQEYLQYKTDKGHLSKKELKEYIVSDNTYFRDKSKKARFWMSMVNDPESQISKFTEFLRKEEYYANTNLKKGKLKILLRLYYQRRKNCCRICKNS